MNESNKRKNEFLGMPHGTANGKLRKNIIFKLVQQTNQDNCFRCGELILTVDELSIEHKLPWEGRSVELFWDLDNIAFSHLKCNKPHRISDGAMKLRKVGAENEAWCSGCQEFLPKINFNNVRTRWNGVHAFCKVCKGKTDHVSRDNKCKQFIT